MPAKTTTLSLWSDTSGTPKFPAQIGPIEVDVCVIGGGLTGLTTADLLHREGKSVAVIELGRLGGGETSHTTAHLTETFDIDYQDLLSRFGEMGATLAAESMRQALDRIEENAAHADLQCDFERVSGSRFAETKDQLGRLATEAKLASRLGLEADLILDTPLPFKTAGALRFRRQAQFHPLKYLFSLAQRLKKGGVQIFEETRMLDVEESDRCLVHTDRGTITASDVLIAAHVPSTNRFFLQTKIAAYRTYAVAARLAGLNIEPRGLFWDLEKPYHYIRSAEIDGAKYVILGGEDHKTGQGEPTSNHFEKLERWAQDRFAIERITHRWSGQIIEPVDGLPYIGRNPLSNRVYVATGFSGTGLTMGTMAGSLIADLMTGRPNPWAELYDPSRVKPLASIKNFLAENIDFPSHIIGDRLTPAEATGAETIRENEGAIVRVGAKKVAAYRDPQGELHLMSPVCPHLGCYVHWNGAEKSWDCPCHGSRFDPVGKLLNGPAVQDLASEEIDENAAMIPERYEQPGLFEGLGSPLMTFCCPIKS